MSVIPFTVTHNVSISMYLLANRFTPAVSEVGIVLVFGWVEPVIRASGGREGGHGAGSSGDQPAACISSHVFSASRSGWVSSSATSRT